MSLHRSIIISLAVLASPYLAQAAVWPGASTGVNIGSNLAANYETSGLHWDSSADVLYTVSDEGILTQLNTSGTVLSNWTNLTGDLEGVTMTGSNTYVYLGYETGIITEFNPATSAVTGNNWSVSSSLGNTDSNQGLEGLTFVPNGFHSYDDTNSGGVFLASVQETGTVMVFDVNLSSNGTVTLLDQFTPVASRTDIADLFFSTDTGLLYVLYDSANIVTEVLMDSSHTVSAEYTLPSEGHNQEGFTLITDCLTSTTATAYIAQDDATNHQIFAYTGYPVTCLVTDTDGDGTGSDSDCNDADATVISEQTYYLDADSDGLGDPTVTTTVCSVTAPSGYVANANEASHANDTIANAGVEIKDDHADNDGDGRIDEYNTVARNGRHPTFRTYDPTRRSDYTTAVESVRPLNYGRISVRYADNSVYHYTIFTNNSKRKVNITLNGKGNIKVINKKNGRRVRVNVYTGRITKVL